MDSTCTYLHTDNRFGSDSLHLCGAAGTAGVFVEFHMNLFRIWCYNKLIPNKELIMGYKIIPSIDTEQVP